MPISHELPNRRAVRAGLLVMPPPQRAERGAEPRPAAPSRLRRILVATDGTPASSGALAVAALLARRDGAEVDVVSTLPRWDPAPPAHESLDMTSELVAHRLALVIPQSERAFGGGGLMWSVRIVDGNAVPSILDIAETEGFDLLVTGVRRGWIDRLLRRPTALAMARATSIPVLAVPRSAAALPTRAVVGVGGTNADLPVGLAALRILDGPATLHLVHVRTADGAAADVPAYEDGPPAGGLAPHFDRVERALIGRVPPSAVRRAVLRGGEPAERLLRHAARVGADLIALGPRATASLKERVLGGVSRRILRSADCPVLLLGPAGAGAGARAEPAPGHAAACTSKRQRGRSP